jgi:hypothetical protein
MERKTTVDVRASTLAELKDVKKNKREINAKSIDDVIKWLLDKHLDQGDADGAAGMEEEEADGPQKERKLNVRDPLYSLEILSEREGMLYYLTGFERSEVDLVVKRFGEVLYFCLFHIACQRSTMVSVVLMSSDR